MKTAKKAKPKQLKPMIIDKPQLDIKTHTVAQFVAEYFANQDTEQGTHYGEEFHYSSHLDGQCWNGFVGLVADAGAVLEDLVQALARQNVYVDEWYDVIEESASAFHKLLLRARGWPAVDDLIKAYVKVCKDHMEADE